MLPFAEDKQNLPNNRNKSRPSSSPPQAGNKMLLLFLQLYFIRLLFGAIGSLGNAVESYLHLTEPPFDRPAPIYTDHLFFTKLVLARNSPVDIPDWTLQAPCHTDTFVYLMCSVRNWQADGSCQTLRPGAAQNETRLFIIFCLLIYLSIYFWKAAAHLPASSSYNSH